MKTVVFGLLGPVLDHGAGADRWNKWRPTVGLCQQEDLPVHRFELLHQRRFTRLAEQITADIRTVSPETEVRLHPVEMPDPWDFETVYGELFDFAARYPFDPDGEKYLIHITTGTHVAQICLFLLTESHRLPGRLIQTAPPKDKGKEGVAGSYSVIDLDLSKYDRLAQRFDKETADDVSFLKSGIATRNEAFNRLVARMEQVAMRSPEPILLMGPTGSGKSRLARNLYTLKREKQQLAGRFIEVNCATLRGDTAMSTLFGHRKGAFTGAAQDRDGLLRAADGGMLFLDEIGELGLDEQALLLRAIEEKRFLPMGADTESESRFQLICGTNRDLHADVARGRFREDLLARVQLWTFRLPSLRERPEDVEPNLDYELDAYARQSGRRVTFNKEARERFLRFANSAEAFWCANFRDLNNAVVRMATLAPGGRITTDEVTEEIRRLEASWRRPNAPAQTGMSVPPLPADAAFLVQLLGKERLAETDLFDRMQLAAVLAVCRESHTVSAAGRKLFAASRTKKAATNDADRLRKYLARFGLSWREIAATRV